MLSEVLSRVKFSYPCTLLFAGLLPKEKPPLNVVGDVGGRIAIIVVGMLMSCQFESCNLTFYSSALDSLKCLSIGTPNTTTFPFVPNGK